VIIFTSDFANSSKAWPIFGAGPRSCAGASYALAVISEIDAGLRHHPLFEPELKHRYSGRHNDEVWTRSELLYFLAKVLRVLLPSSLVAFMGRNSRNKGQGDDALAGAGREEEELVDGEWVLLENHAKAE
jgi:hypothetical protein